MVPNIPFRKYARVVLLSVLTTSLILVSVRGQPLPDHPQPQQSLPDHPQPQYPLPDHPKPQPSAAAPAKNPPVDSPWPREAVRGNTKILMYQPQLETWEGDELHAYAAISVEDQGNAKLKYGVIWFTAWTEVDKVNRQVTMDRFEITRIKVPTMADKEQEYRDFLQAKLPGKSRTIALDRLEAALAAVASERGVDVVGVPVNNDPPRVIFSTKPATLVLIDGPPKFKDLGGTDLQRVLNTKAYLGRDTKKNKYYLSIMDGWLESPDLTAGPWSYVKKTPDDLKEI